MMKQDNDNISNDDAVTQLDKNFSRLLKQAGSLKKPSKRFRDLLIGDALDELKQQRVEKVEAKTITIRSKWLERILGWAAMIAVAWGAGLVIIITVLLKMNLLLEIVVVLTIVFNWLSYLGGHI